MTEERTTTVRSSVLAWQPCLARTANASGNLRGTSRLAVNARWLMRLRWVAVAGQFITVCTARYGLSVELRVVPLFLIISATAATNLAFTCWLRRRGTGSGEEAADRRGHALLMALMTFDLGALTALLYFSGGPANPFTVFYFVNLSLSAVILPARWGWILTGVSMLCLGILFLFHLDLPALEQPAAWGPWRTELTLGQVGLWVALAACPGVVIYFVARVARELQQRDRELRRAELHRSRSEKLEALGTLAAGAGHELATPLSTIAVIAKELTNHLQGADVPGSVMEDVALIRSEVDHCRSILKRMTGSAGQAAGEEVVEVRIEDLIREVLNGLRGGERVEVVMPAMPAIVPAGTIATQLQNVAQAIRGVVQNGLDADPSGRVTLSAQLDGGELRLVVQDHGPGMSQEVLTRAGEPFFTTKEPGKGMGLGLFLTRSVIERLGGTLDLQSESGRGVTALIRLPRTARPPSESLPA